MSASPELTLRAKPSDAAVLRAAWRRTMMRAVPFAASGLGLLLTALLLGDALDGARAGSAYLVASQTVVVFAAAAALFVFDAWREARAHTFETALTGLVLEAGQAISEGRGVESGLHFAATRRGGPAGRAVLAILSRASDRSLEEALRETADTDPRRELAAMASLLAQTTEAEGDVGERMRTLGTDLSAVARAERLFMESLGTELVMLAGLGLFIVPGLFCLVGQQSGFEQWDLAMRFFAWLAVLIAAADGVAAWSAHRVFGRAPLYVALVEAIFVLFMKVIP